MYLLTCFHISIELPLNCRLPLNSHSRSQYTLYVCTYVSIHIISQLINTPIHNVMSFHIAHSFVFRRNFFSRILILTTDSPFGAHSNRNDSLTRNICESLPSSALAHAVGEIHCGVPYGDV